MAVRRRLNAVLVVRESFLSEGAPVEKAQKADRYNVVYDVLKANKKDLKVRVRPDDLDPLIVVALPSQHYFGQHYRLQSECNEEDEVACADDFNFEGHFSCVEVLTQFANEHHVRK